MLLANFNRKEHLRHRAVSLRQHGFLVHVGLLVITLSFQTGNNACVLYCSALQSAVERAFSCNTWDADLCWIIRETDDRWIPRLTWILSDCSGGSVVCLPDSATATRMCRRFHQFVHCVTASAAARTPVDCSELHQQPVDAVLHPVFVQKLCYKLMSGITFNFIRTSKFYLLYWTASKLAHLLDTASKFALFSVSGLKAEKLTKKANQHEN